MEKDLLETKIANPKPSKDVIDASNQILRTTRLLKGKGELDSRSLPKTYELVQRVNRETTPDNPMNSHAMQDVLPHVERMAKQGMKPQQIAARLGIAWFAFREAMDLFPDVNAALNGGLARGIDEQSESLYRAGLKGDVSANKFFLQTKGEFNTPRDNSPAVIVNIGEQKAAITTTAVMSLVDRQRALLELDGEFEEVDE